MKLSRFSLVAVCLAGSIALADQALSDEKARYPALTGLNLSGAEFGAIDGDYGTAYRYPGDDEIDDVARRGFTIIRLPFLWERLQPALGGELQVAERGRLDHVVTRALERKLAIILDVHNYARWRGEVVGSEQAPVVAFADLWRRLAERYRDRDGVIFGLMNEPHDMSTEAWASAAQAAVTAIREAGACNRILVPGNAWSGAHSWRSDAYGTPNAVAMARLDDPAKRMTFEFHQYLDANWSGSGATCRPPSEVVAALAVATEWLEEQHATGFLAEIGAGRDPRCIAGLTAMLAHLDAHTRVWRGWTAWAAGAWWPKDYPLLLRAEDGKDPPQFSTFTTWRAPAGKGFGAAACDRPGRER